MKNQANPANSEDVSELNEQPLIKSEKKKINKIIILITLLFLVAAVGSGYGIYMWQQSRLDAIAAQNSDLKKQSEAANAKLALLQKGYDSLSEKLNTALESKENDSMLDTLVPVSSPTLTLKVNSATRFNAQGLEDAPNTGIAVEITISNATSSAIAFSIFDASLQDSQLQVYQILPSYSGIYYPKNYVPLTNQTIQPGTSVKGALTFGVKDLDLMSFNFRYGTQSLSFKL